MAKQATTKEPETASEIDDGGAFDPTNANAHSAPLDDDGDIVEPNQQEAPPAGGDDKPAPDEDDILSKSDEILSGNKKPGSAHFKKMQQKFEQEKSELQKVIEELRQKSGEPPEDYDPEWKSKLEQEQEAKAKYEQELQELREKYQEADERLQVFDLENRPDFQEKFDYQREIETAEQAAEAAGIDPSAVGRLFRAKGNERLRLMADLERNAQKNGRSIPSYLFSKLDNALSAADEKEAGRNAALENVAETRKKLQEQQKSQYLQQEQRRREQMALEAKIALEHQTREAEKNEPYFRSDEGREAMQNAIRDFQNPETATPDRLIQWRLSHAALPKYREIAISALKELERIKTSNRGGGADPGALTGGAYSGDENWDDTDDGGAFAPENRYVKR